jgi:adenylyltransferase/sulfurtransferase
MGRGDIHFLYTDGVYDDIQAGWQAGHLVGALPITVELTFNALDSWPKETLIVFYSNEGRRSLDKAAYFQAYGFTNARSLDGGIQDWPRRLESPLIDALP